MAFHRVNIDTMAIMSQRKELSEDWSDLGNASKMMLGDEHTALCVSAHVCASESAFENDLNSK